MSATKIAREEKKKTSFIIELDDLKVISGFSYEQKGKVLEYIENFAMYDFEPDITTVEGMAASFFTRTIEKYNERYLVKCEQNANNRRGSGKKKNELEDKKSEERDVLEVLERDEEPEDEYKEEAEEQEEDQREELPSDIFSSLFENRSPVDAEYEELPFE